jgi:hypothetical protein
MVRPGTATFTDHMTEPTRHSSGLDQVVKAIAASGTAEPEAQAMRAHR